MNLGAVVEEQINKRGIASKSAIHTIGWGLFILASWFMAETIDPMLTTGLLFPITMAFLMAFAYANYFLFVPSLSDKKSLLIYCVVVIGAMMLYYSLPRFIDLPRPHGQMGWRRNFPGRPILIFGRLRFLLFLFVYALSTGLGVFKLLFKYKQRQLAAENEKSRAELSLLKSQVNPHFLFNSLQTIHYLTAHKAENAPDAVLQLSDILRYTLTQATNDFVPITDEIEFVEKYIELQKLRLTDKTIVSFTKPQAQPGLDIAPMLLIPFIENCFKYGISTHQKTTISIKMSISAQKEFRMVCSNRIFNAEGKQGARLGIENTRKRLEMLYPQRHNLSINNSGNAFTVLLSITL